MKFIATVIPILVVVCLITVQGGLSSCTKDKTIYDTVTVNTRDTIVVTDTVIVCDTLNKDSVWAANSWIVDEVWENHSSSNIHYVRGGENTTGVNYALLRLTFNANGTGTYIDETGTSHSITWEFTSPDKRNMTLAVGPPYAISFEWSLIEITKNSLT